MTKKKTAKDIPFIDIPRHWDDEEPNEVAVFALLDRFQSYKDTLTQAPFAEGEIVYFDYDRDVEQYFFFRKFTTQDGCKGTVFIYVKDEHLKQAMGIAEGKKLTEGLPPLKKKKKIIDIL
ncbi:hypothetical protein [Stagnimonas aquatica]|uniref:hypothetical protein n=1 Tax=Stagnimonas aquatica TaxID=2689987 RepID=UPI0011CDB2DA|nr:hypothetical protein [Stagnimonas aquatica]